MEDDLKIASFIKKGLHEQGYIVDAVHNGEDALYSLKTYDYELIILDLMLPIIDGLTLCKIIRKNNLNIPIIMLSAKDTIDDKITGLNEGANDYIAKPFSFNELLARIRVQLRHKFSDANNILKIADLEIDLISRRVSRNNAKITLTAKEFSLLEFMIRHKNEVLSETSIGDGIYDFNENNISNIVNVYIYRLRSKIDKDFEPKLIKTVRGMGFILNDE